MCLTILINILLVIDLLSFILPSKKKKYISQRNNCHTFLRRKKMRGLQVLHYIYHINYPLFLKHSVHCNLKPTCSHLFSIAAEQDYHLPCLHPLEGCQHCYNLMLYPTVSGKTCLPNLTVKQVLVNIP